MKSQMYRKFMHNILKVFIVFALAVLPLGVALAASGQGNSSPRIPVEAKSQPLGLNPSTGVFVPQMTTTTFSYAGPVVNIPDNNPAGVCVPINVTATGTITAVRLTGVAMTHTYPGDVIVSLISPGGSFLTVFNRPLANHSAADLVASAPLNFYDSAPNDAEAMGTGLTTNQVVCQDDGKCDYFPNPDGFAGSLTNFAGFNGIAPNGVWQFCAYDVVQFDVGTINAVTLEISTNMATSLAITSSATNPTSTSPIPVTFTFGGPVTGFTLSDITVGNGTAGNFVAINASTYTADITPVAAGAVTVDVAAGVATDVGGTGNAAASQFSITYAGTAPTVSITSTATNPTSTSPIPVTITFSQPVTGFTLGDITVGNSTAGNLAGSGAIYTADITPTAAGTVTVDVAAGVAVNGGGAGNLAAPQFSITYGSAVNPTVTAVSLTSIMNPGPASFTVAFNKAVADPAGNSITDDVTNPANYLIVETGANGTFNTASCLGGLVADDTQVTVNTVIYDNATFKSTVVINGGVPLSTGRYRLFVCGTTSIVDLIGTPLNGGTDFTFDFTVQANSTTNNTSNRSSSRQAAVPTILPATGFAPGVITDLPFQPLEKTYTTYNDMWLEIPKLGVRMNIVGVPQNNDGWDVTWLGTDAGWLAGSAFPTWNGNTVLTGHVWDALNNPGPFYGLNNMGYGDKLLIHAWGKVYTYEVRSTLRITPSSVGTVMKHEELAWVTLVTCENYNEKSGAYTYRRLVRAVLVSAVEEK